MANELQTRYSALVDAKLRQTLVTMDDGMCPVFNTKYEGDPKAGAVKIPVRNAEVSVGNYDKVTGKALSQSATSYITVTDFNDVAVNELIDGYDADAVPDNVLADRLESAAFSGSLKLDQDGILELETNGTKSTNTVASTAVTAYDNLVAARTALSKANVPVDGRYALVTPDIMAYFLTDARCIQGDALAAEARQAGYIGKLAGFYLKETNNTATKTEFICGHQNWATRIREWVKEPYIQSLDGDSNFIGASAVKGRWVFKHKVTNPLAFYIKARA
ncbi:MAG: hypothetical protein RSA99_00750 [Oscillospiraceae bacterium]